MIVSLAFQIPEGMWWTGGDLNPRPPECKSGVHTRLNYRPKQIINTTTELNLFDNLYDYQLKERSNKNFWRSLQDEFEFVVSGGVFIKLRNNR